MDDKNELVIDPSFLPSLLRPFPFRLRERASDSPWYHATEILERVCIRPRKTNEQALSGRKDELTDSLPSPSSSSSIPFFRSFLDRTHIDSPFSSPQDLS